MYRYRWQVELFFKWIKQHLRIKAFYGTTENAVKTQIWIAISVYVLVAIVKKTMKLDQSLYTILQILSVTLFEKTPIYRALAKTTYTNENYYFPNQLKLFEWRWDTTDHEYILYAHRCFNVHYHSEFWCC